MKHAKKSSIFRPLRALLIALFWVAVWQLAAMSTGSDLLLPGPIAVLRRVAELIQTSAFWRLTGGTLARVLVGCALGAVTGGLAAVIAYRFRLVRELLNPLLTVIRATPVASFILVAIVWMGADRVPSFTAFLMVLPVIWGAVLSALDGMDRGLCEVASLYSFSSYRMLTSLYLPTALPGFFSGCVTAVGLGWKAGVAAEVLCSVKNSIGRKLHEAQIYLETTDLLAWTLVVVLLSLLFEALLHLIALRIVRKRELSEQVAKGEERTHG